MKLTKTILALAGLFLITTASAFGQTKDKLTQAEQFGVQAGTLIERKFIDIGEVNGILIQVIKFKDLISGKTQSALRFESSNSKTATLDAYEIDGLMKSIKNLQTLVLPTTPEVYTEVTFRSKSGFEAGAYFDEGSWTAYIRLEEYDRESFRILTTANFSVLLGYLEQAKLKM